MTFVTSADDVWNTPVFRSHQKRSDSSSLFSEKDFSAHTQTFLFQNRKESRPIGAGSLLKLSASAKDCDWRRRKWTKKTRTIWIRRLTRKRIRKGVRNSAFPSRYGTGERAVRRSRLIRFAGFHSIRYKAFVYPVMVRLALFQPT